MHRKGRATLRTINSRGGVTTMVGTNDTIGTMPIYMARSTGYGEEEISVYHRDITVEPISIVVTPNMNTIISDDDYDTVFHTNDPVHDPAHRKEGRPVSTEPKETPTMNADDYAITTSYATRTGATAYVTGVIESGDASAEEFNIDTIVDDCFTYDADLQQFILTANTDEFWSSVERNAH